MAAVEHLEKSMETYTDFLWFITKVLGVFVGVIITFAISYAIFVIRKYRTFITHPTDWLTVMSYERFDSMASLCSLMNAERHVTFFEIELQGIRKLLFSIDFIPSIVQDLAWLENEGFTERRRVILDNNNCVVEPEEPLVYRDSEGKIIGFNREYVQKYHEETQWRKTEKGKRVKRRGSSGEKTTIPEGVVGAH